MMVVKLQIAMVKRFVRMLKRCWKMNPVRTRWIANKQRLLLRDSKGRLGNTIIFLVPGEDIVNGGIMSIISLAEETAKLRHIHRAEVFICTAPGDPPLLRFTRFENSRVLFGLAELLSCIKPNSSLLIHIPEIYVSSFVEHNSKLRPLLATFKVEYNILLQNIDYIPSKAHVEKLKILGNVSITTAHKAYANTHTKELLCCPLWHLSVWVSPEHYDYRPFRDKKNVIVVSPDSHPNRVEILTSLRGHLPEFDFVVVKNMTYQDYKSLIAAARFALTFGEGLDGYFAETVFSGGIGCAVYNDRFFTEAYRSLPCIYPTWESLIENLPGDIAKLSNESLFAESHKRQFDQLAADYSYAEYKQNLELFYRERFPYTDSKKEQPITPMSTTHEINCV